MRIGYGGIVYYTFTKELPKPYSKYSGPYISPRHAALPTVSVGLCRNRRPEQLASNTRASVIPFMYRLCKHDLCLSCSHACLHATLSMYPGLSMYVCAWVGSLSVNAWMRAKPVQAALNWPKSWPAAGSGIATRPYTHTHTYYMYIYIYYGIHIRQ